MSAKLEQTRPNLKPENELGTLSGPSALSQETLALRYARNMYQSLVTVARKLDKELGQESGQNPPMQLAQRQVRDALPQIKQVISDLETPGASLSQMNPQDRMRQQELLASTDKLIKRAGSFI